MKKLFSILFIVASVLCHAQELIVTPLNTQGWVFGTGQLTAKKTTANWFLGYLNGFPQSGDGSLWFYSGNADGWVYADFHGVKDVPLGSLTRLSYNTFTSNVSAGREDINLAPSFNIYLNVKNSPAGSVVLDHSPGVYGTVARGQWLTRNILLAKWTCNKSDPSVKKTLSEWLEIYPNANINKIRVQTGSTDPETKRIFGGWTLGTDNVIIGYGLTPPTTYNFEPSTKDEIDKVSVNPITIFMPVYYINNGVAEGKLEDVVPVEDDLVVPATETPKPSPYKTSDSVYVPIVFTGNTTLKSVLSQLTDVGNPDETIPTGGIKITKGGTFLFEGVPFYIPTNKNNCWDANAFNNNEENKFNIKVGLENVIEVHTIMNTTYSTGDAKTTFLVFTGSKGEVFVKELVINKDIRDIKTSSFSKIVSPTKVVWSRPLSSIPNQEPGAQIMLDSQTIVLPESFQNQELVSVTVEDKGKKNKQRSFIAGLTVKIKIQK